MNDVFMVAVPFMVVPVLVALTMREEPLAGRETVPSHDPAAAARYVSTSH
jgi:hypothetical protein